MMRELCARNGVALPATEKLRTDGGHSSAQLQRVSHNRIKVLLVCNHSTASGAQPRPRRQGCRVSETPALDVLPLLLAPFCHCWLEAGLPVWWARREPLLLALLAAQLKELPATQAHTPPGRLALRHLRTPSLANSSARRRQWAAAAGVACMGGPWACCC